MPSAYGAWQSGALRRELTMLRDDGGFAEIGAKPSSAGQRCAEVSTWRDLGGSVAGEQTGGGASLFPCRSPDAASPALLLAAVQHRTVGSWARADGAHIDERC